MPQKNKHRKLIWLLMIFVIVSLSLIFAMIFGVFQKQVVHDDYSIAYQIDGKLYDVSPINAKDVAVDKKKQQPSFYFRISNYEDLEYLFHIAFRQYEISSSSQPQKYAGALDYSVGDSGYVTQRREHLSKKESEAVYLFHNKNGKEIARYDSKKSSQNPYIVRIKPTIWQGYKKNKISNYNDFLNITQMFKDRLGKKVIVKVDNRRKLVLFSIQ